MRADTLAILALPLVAGCGLGASAPEATSAVLESPPPGPYGLAMTVDGVVLAGNTLSFAISGGQPGVAVGVAVGNTVTSGAYCPSFLGGQCLDVTNASGQPQVVRLGRFDAAGRATLTATVPSGFTGPRVFYFQAASVGANAATSGVVPKLVPSGSGGVEYQVNHLSGTVAPGGTGFTGTYGESWVSLATGQDRCTYLGTAVGVPTTTAATCVGCDFAFDVTVNAWRDGSIAGDCADLPGYDAPNRLPTSFLLRVGFDADYDFAGYGVQPALMTYYQGAWVPTGFSAELAGSAWSWSVDFSYSGVLYAY